MMKFLLWLVIHQSGQEKVDVMGIYHSYFFQQKLNFKI